MSFLSDRKSQLFLFLIYWLLIISYSLFLHWNDTMVCHSQMGDLSINLSVNFFTTYQEIFDYADKSQSGGDMFSYIRGGKAFLIQGFKLFIPGRGWLWGPGMPILYATIISISPKVPFLLTLLIITSSLWALLFTNIVLLLGKFDTFKNYKLAFFVPLVLFLVPLFKNYYFWEGLWLSESIPTGAFFIAITCILHAFVGAHLYKQAVLSSFFLVLAAYFRIQFDLINLTLMATAWLSTLVCFMMRHVSFMIYFRQFLKSTVKFLLILTVVYISTTISYRFHVNHFTLAPELLYMYKNVWARESIFKDQGLNYMPVLNPSKASEFEIREKVGEKIPYQEYQAATVSYIKKNPLTFLLYKSQFLVKNFIEDIFWCKVFLTLLGCICCALFFLPKGIILSLLVFYNAFFIGTTAPSFIFHFEPRYLYPLKVMILFSSMFLLPYLCQEILRRIKDFKMRKLCLY